MLFKTAFRNLLRNRRRTITVGLTVAIGTASLFMFHGFNSGIMNQYQDNCVHARYGHGQINMAGYRDKVFEKPWEHWMSGWNTMKEQLKSVAGINQVFPRIEFFGLLTNGRVTVSGKGQGIDGVEEAKFFYTMNIESGETLSNQPEGILLGRGLARALDLKPGDRVTILANTVFGSLNAVDLYVTGVFHTGAKDFDDTVFRVPLKQAQLLLDTDKIEHVALGLTAIEKWPQISKAITEKFNNVEATPFAELDKVYYQHSVDWLNSQFGVIEAIILAIIILGIFNSVSTTLFERKQEIGNLRANGESVLDVAKLLALEALALGVVSALAGILFTYILNITVLKNGILMPPAPGLTRQFYVVIELQWLMALKTFAMGAGVAVIGTLLAAIRVLRLPISEALRSV